MNETILVVDDEPKIVKQARDYLERNNFRVVTTGDGQSALTLVRHERPDLVVLDIVMPGLDGYETLDRIRAMGVRVPVALTSISTLIRTQGMGDLYRIYLGAKRDGIPYRLAYIPNDFKLEPEEEFDPKYMRALFDLGYEMARDGYDWATSPPGVILP